jgi:hypothetical protein
MVNAHEGNVEYNGKGYNFIYVKGIITIIDRQGFVLTDYTTENAVLLNKLESAINNLLNA